ncbi:MAG: peptide deformylase [Gammaproteobacteria bacterium]|jgi:peptide deformylase
MSTAQYTDLHLLKLVDYSHPILHKKIALVQFPLSKQDKQSINDMKYSIQPEQLKKAKASFDAAAGMAANQWGINKQIFIFCPERNSVEKLEVIINPSYEPISDLATGVPNQDFQWEGCFSVPLTVGKVQRYTHIRVKYQNEDGKIIVRELRDWAARVWQHENDHLNGLLFYDNPYIGKCVEKKNFASQEELESFYNTVKAEKRNLTNK